MSSLRLIGLLLTVAVVGCYPADSTESAAMPTGSETDDHLAASASVGTAEPETVDDESLPLGASDMIEIGEVGIIPILFQTMGESGTMADCDFDDPFDMCQ